MLRILAMSSQVARGHVGLSAIVPVLQRLEIEVVALPTVLLSNHPGHARASGQPIDVSALSAMLATLEVNGWLADIDAILIGYLPSVDHVELAIETIARIRHLRHGKAFTVLCDPVIGDDPKGIYIDRGAANAIRDHLIAKADILTPNRFELSWMSGIDVHDNASATVAAHLLPAPVTVATSVPAGQDRISNVCTSRQESIAATVKRFANVPNGTGDVFSAMFLAHFLASHGKLDASLAKSTASLATIIAQSVGNDELNLITNANAWAHTMPAETAAITAISGNST